MLNIRKSTEMLLCAEIDGYPLSDLQIKQDITVDIQSHLPCSIEKDVSKSMNACRPQRSAFKVLESNDVSS